mgnify:CR=1 FL=1
MFTVGYDIENGRGAYNVALFETKDEAQSWVAEQEAVHPERKYFIEYQAW